MALHTPTLFVSYILCALTILGLLLASYRDERPAGIGLWMGWLGLQAGGLSLYLLRDQNMPWLSLVLANILLSSALSCGLGAFQVFHQRPLRAQLLSLPVLFAALISALGLDSPEWRIPLINTLFALQSLLIALVVLYNRTRDDLTSLLVAGPLLLNGAVLLFRTLTLSLGYEPNYFLLNSSTYQSATLCMLLVSLLSTSLGYLLLHRERSERAIRAMALHDPLTGCLNRRSFQFIMDKELARLSRGGTQLGLLLADIDHFKQVNDTFGHAAGDAVLVDLVRKIEHVLRSQDFIFRYGGEEFCILLPRCGPVESMATAERIRQTIEAGSVQYGRQTIRYTVSIGCACSQGADEKQREHLFLEADRAMYAAKLGGRNRVVFAGDLPQRTGGGSQTS